MKISVILSTYNHPDWLERTLWGYAAQTEKDFEIVIADDGSNDKTRERIDQLREQTGLNIQHVWHEDDGFRKCTILNKAITASRSDYLLFSDGDCVPRADFLAVHIERRKPGFFLSGGYFKLPMETSLAITNEDITSQRAFCAKWLRQRGLKQSFKTMKLRVSGAGASLMNCITTTSPTWNGHNASGWKTDIIAANGFDERMAYGGEDRELGERMMNNGLIGVQIRYSAICIHLDHSRGYVNDEDLARNKAIRKETKRQKLTRTAHGIEKDE